MLPPGLSYQPDFISAPEAAELLAQLPGIERAPFLLRGFPSKRLVASFGMALDFRGGTSWAQRPPPDFLEALIERVAEHLSRPRKDLAHILVTEYPPGAIINWHRDAAQFEVICGVSLGSPATLKLRQCVEPQGGHGYGRSARTRGAAAEPAAHQEKATPRGQAISLVLEPRSLYIMRGPARSDWEHSIAPLAATRFSITLRTLYR